MNKLIVLALVVLGLQACSTDHHVTRLSQGSRIECKKPERIWQTTHGGRLSERTVTCAE